jgi:hypothetical protein
MSEIIENKSSDQEDEDEEEKFDAGGKLLCTF